MRAATIKSAVKDGRLVFVVEQPMREMSIEELNNDRNYTEELENLKRQREAIKRYAKINQKGLDERFVG